MNVQIITSSYPAFKGDPGGTAGLFVQSFAGELASQGHTVVVQPVSRKQTYQEEDGILIKPIPWSGGDQELASMNFFNPLNWLIFFKFFLNGRKCTQAAHQKYHIDRTLCMWIIPCGLFGYWINKKFNKKYDVWALGSDVWKVQKIPFFGKYWIKKIVQHAEGVFADGAELADHVGKIAAKSCEFLPSSRVLPKPENNLTQLQPKEVTHMLFVGRYHKNKGPDLLLNSLAILSQDIKNKICVHLFGCGPLEGDLKMIYEQLDLKSFVQLNGPINAQEFSNYLKRVSYLLIPSRVESIPLVFSDALQMGTPVISTPVGDLTHLIEKYQCGIVAKDISEKSFSTAIEEAMSKDNKNFSQNAEKIYKNFAITNSVARWLDQNNDRPSN